MKKTSDANIVGGHRFNEETQEWESLNAEQAQRLASDFAPPNQARGTPHDALTKTLTRREWYHILKALAAYHQNDGWSRARRLSEFLRSEIFSLLQERNAKE